MCITYSPNDGSDAGRDDRLRGQLWDAGAGRDDRLRGQLCDGRVPVLELVIGRRSIVVVPEARVVVVGRSRLQRGGDIAIIHRQNVTFYVSYTVFLLT